MLKRLIDKLNSVFRKEPELATALTISKATSFDVSVKDSAVTVNGTVIDITSITVGQLATAISALSGFTATASSEFSGYLARGLYEGQGSGTEVALHYPTSLLYSEMQVHAWSLQQQADQSAAALRQLFPKTAEGEWLDYWFRDYFGIRRSAGESDSAYLTRAMNEILAPTQNNVALARIVKNALGVDIAIVDADRFPAGELTIPKTDAPGRFLLDMAIDASMSNDEAAALISMVKDVVRRYKAAGTDFVDSPLRKSITPVEVVPVEEAVALTVTATISESLQQGNIQYGAGWKYGITGATPKYGLNAPIKEQAIITVLNAADDSVVSVQRIGG